MGCANACRPGTIMGPRRRQPTRFARGRWCALAGDCGPAEGFSQIDNSVNGNWTKHNDDGRFMDRKTGVPSKGVRREAC